MKHEFMQLGLDFDASIKVMAAYSFLSDID